MSKMYRLRSNDGFFGLTVTMKIEQNEDMEKYCRSTMEHFNNRNSRVIQNSSSYLQYFDFICKAILSICFEEFSKGKQPFTKQVLQELENRELIVFDNSLKLEIPVVPLLENIHFDLAVSLKQGNIL